MAADVAVIEEALAELDAGRIDAAIARLKAFVAATLARRVRHRPAGPPSPNA